MTATSETDARAALRAAMQRWREPLMAVTSLPTKLSIEPWHSAAWASDNEGTDPPIFWLSCDGALDNPAFTKRLEAAELFALLAQVDYAMWSELVREFWSSEAEWTDFLATRSALRVGLGYEVFRGVDGITELCTHINTRLILPGSTDYKETRQAMAHIMGILPELLPVVPVRIDHFAHEENVSRLIQDIDEVLSQYGTGAHASLRITQLKVDATNYSVDHGAVHSFVSIRELGVQVTDLPMVDVLPRSNIVQDFTQSFCSLLDAGSPQDGADDSLSGSEDDVRRPPGVEKLVVNGDMKEEVVPSVFSAIHSSRSLQAIEFDITRTSPDNEQDNVAQEDEAARATLDVARRQLVWWMAFALFRRPPLATVELVVHALLPQDVAWMQEILTAHNPMELLFPDEDAVSPPPSCVALATNLLLYDPHQKKNGSRQRTWIDRTLKPLTVVGASRDGFLPVLLPGWGKAWVRDNKATVSPQAESERPALRSPTHLIVREMNAASIDAVLSLLQLVGSGLQRLEIDDVDCPDTPMDMLCRNVLEACPNLEELELGRMKLTNLTFLLDAIQASRLPRLQKLTLWEMELHERDAVHEILVWLANPREQLSIQLRKLRLGPRNHSEAATLDAALRMLSSNTRLREVAFAFDIDPLLRPHYEARFQHCSGSSVSEPLAPPCITAFLSVTMTGARPPQATASEQTRRTTDALHQFDSCILSTILTFAATPRIRSVQFTAAGHVDEDA